jgi:hypothetical protein
LLLVFWSLNIHVKKHKREYTYIKALGALREGRNNNPAHKDAFNSRISDLKKKNPYWVSKSVDDQDLTARTLFTEENTDGEIRLL